MESTLWIIMLIVGLLAGIFAGYLYGIRKRAAKELALRSEYEDKLDNLRKEHEAKQEQLRHEQELKIAQCREEQRNESRQHYEEMLRQLRENFSQSIATMKEEVQNSTNNLLQQRQKEFADKSEESLGRIIEPLQENIRQMRQAVQDNTVKAVGYSGELKAGIESVLKQSQEAKASADRLANALSVGNKAQGNWGERILTELLESSGLRKGIHFDTQEFIRDATGAQIKGDSGRGLQPDVILHIERGHDVIIDAKVSLTAFLNYQDAGTEEDRQRYLKEHIASVRGQVRKLVKADYANYLEGALDYVIMFVPISQALYLATQEDPSLWREAMEQKVYIADEQTLYAALKIISLNWRQQAQADNHAQVYKLAGEMLARVRQFADRFGAVGKALDSASAAYEDACKKLSDSGQSIPVTANKLIKLGARYDKPAAKLNPLLQAPDDNDNSDF